MGKRLTSFLFGALAVVLLGAPAQAQNDAVKAAKRSALSQKLDPQRKAIREKAVEARKLGDFSVLKSGNKSGISLLEPIAMNKGQATNLQGFSTRQLPAAPIRKTAANRVGEVVDANGIITAPAEGEHKFYTREGGAYFVSGQSVYLDTQSGYAELVECEDGTVYMLDPISTSQNGTWVKGTKNGNTVTFPANQPLTYSTSYMTTLSMTWGVLTTAGKFVRGGSDPFVFNIDGDKLVLQGTAGYSQTMTEDANFMGIYWDDDDSFSGYGCYETVLTYLPGYKPASTTPVQIPEGLQYEKASLYGYAVKNGDYAWVSYTINVGFDGNDVYVQGMFPSFKDAWVKGTLENGIVTFENLQFLGKWYDASYNVNNAWLIGVTYDEVADDYVIGDFLMEYDAETNTFLSLNYAIANGKDTQIYYLDWLYYFGIGPWEEPIAETGAPVDKLPYMNGFGTEEQAADFGIIDANEDGSTWEAYNSAMRYVYDSSNDADDWLISPAILLEEGKEYAFSVDVRAQNGSWPERFEVKLGAEAKVSAMTQTVIASTDVDHNTFVTYENSSVSVSKTGYYYFGIHAISDADEFYLWVDNFAVMAPITSESPRAPRLQVEPNPYGGTRAVVTITAPELNMGGDNLTANLQKVVLYRDGAAVKTYENVAPGGILVYSDENVTSGSHEYMALPFDANGVNGMKSEKVVSIIGLDVPKFPEIVSAFSDNGLVYVSWNPVTEGENGGIVNTDEIEYNIWSVAYEEFMGYIFPFLDEVVATTTETSVVFEAGAESSETGYTDYAITASNEAGESYDDDDAYFSVITGPGLTMPFEEHFLSGGYTQLEWDSWSSGNVDMDVANESSDKDGVAITLYSEVNDEAAKLILGKVTPCQGNPVLLVDLKGDGSVRNLFRLEAEDAFGETTQLACIVPGTEFKTYSISLAEFQDQAVKLNFWFEFNKAGEITIDNIRALDLLDNNLVASIDVPASVKAGQSADVTVKVLNLGKNSAKNYTVTVLADNKQLFSEKVEGVLLPFATKTFNVEYESSIFDDSKDVKLRAEVTYDADLDEDDNAAEAVLAVKASNATKPENVAAEKTDDGVKLTWNAPAHITQEVVEDFENQEVFPLWSIGGITAENHYGAFGDWTVYDGDGGEVWTFNGDLPYDHKTEPHAWQVFDPASLGLSWEVASGKQILLSICPQSVPSNDWLISPELPGIAQTITFKAGQISTTDPSSSSYYGNETFEILVSKKGKAIATFDKIGEGTITKDGLNEFSFELPAGTKYFAIRHTSNDVFGLYIDDITFMAGGGNLTNYNIYVDGKDGVYDDTTETSYIVKKADAANAKWFAVSAVYDNGAESQPVTVIVEGANQEITAIEQIANGKHAVDIYSVDGVLIRQQATSLKGLKGAYIIEGKKVIIK